MSQFCEDQLIWAKYFPATTVSHNGDSLKVKVFEWKYDTAPSPQELMLDSAASLIQRDHEEPCALRVVSIPLRASFLPELAALKPVFQYYSFPSAVLSELLASITNSFGTISLQPDTGVSVAWCHFLCKNIQLRSHGGEDEVNLDDDGRLPQSHYPHTRRWNVCHFVIHTKQEVDKPKCVTLLCFGAPRTMIERFSSLLNNSHWRDAVEEPYLLFNIVYEELYNIVDKLSWRLADIFRPVEAATLNRAGTSDSIEQTTIDFTNLHNISKHIIYMNEAIEAAILTLDDMVSHLTTTQTAFEPVTASLKYRKSTFKSTQLRLRSLEKRMANVISLSYNLVTQQDSKVMQNDSNAMKAIAVMTLIFLPATGISSVCSMPFFKVNFAKPAVQKVLEVATSFWIYWVVSLPLTAMIFLVWYWIYRQAKLKRAASVRKHQRWPRRQKDQDPSSLDPKEAKFVSNSYGVP